MEIEMNIANFLKESFIDYPGKISSVIFSSDCNYRCPACHAKHVLKNSEFDLNEIFNYLSERKNWIEGIVLCGGEPTIQSDLPDFAKKFKERGLSVKLDTNGSNPDMLVKLKDEKLIDYLAMDIKGPENLYPYIIGREIDLKNEIERSMQIATTFPDYEFRTTIAPIDDVYANDDKLKFRWLNQREAKEMAEWVYKTTGLNNSKWFIQRFVSRDEREMVNYQWGRQNLPPEMHETPQIILEQIASAISEIYPNCKIR